MIRGRKEGKSFATWFIGLDNETSNVLLAPPLPFPTIILNPNATSTVTNGNVYSNNNNNTSQNTSSESIQVSTQTSPTTATRMASSLTQADKNVNNNNSEKKDTYREAFENTTRTEQAKFNVRFDNLLLEMQQSIENLSPQNGRVPSGYVTSSYGALMTTYRTRIKDLLVSLSQRLELAVESFDETCANNLSLTSQKVKTMISTLVENRLGESLDLTSDEAVSDLSSLSDDSFEQKSLEDQIAQAVVARVLEVHRHQGDVHLELNDSVDNDTKINYCFEGKIEDKSRSSSSSKKGNITESLLRSMEFNKTDLIVPKERRKVINNIKSNARDINADESNSYEQFADDVSCDRNEYLGEDAIDGESIETSEDVLRKKYNIKRQKPEQNKKSSTAASQSLTINKSDIDTQEVEEITEKVDAAILKLEFKKLRTFAQEALLKPLYEDLSVNEDIEPEPFDESLEFVKDDLRESQMDFDNQIFTFDNVYDPEDHEFPDFNDLDYEYYDVGVDEIDPELSMNLATIMEETEEELAVEEENESDKSVPNWRVDWLLKDADGLDAYRNVVTNKGFVDGCVMVPAKNKVYVPSVGNIDVAALPDLSENEDRDLCDENRFHGKMSKEIVDISDNSKHSTHGSSLANISVQANVDSEEESVFSFSKSSFSDCFTHGIRTKLSSFDSHISENSQSELSNELIHAELDDPKFEIPPESITVPEGEPAKLTCVVVGAQPLDVFWYKARDNLELLENSENYDITKDGNRHDLVMYNTRTEEAGQYMCKAINDRGQCAQHFILTIKKNAQELKKPEFLKTLQGVEVREGQGVKFRCKVKGYPQARIVWYKDGHRIHNQAKYKLERYGNRDYILAIDTATIDDDAEYSVLARNVAGDVRSSAQLIVEPRTRPGNNSATEDKSLKMKHSEMKNKSSDNFPDLSYLPLSRVKQSTELHSPTLPNISFSEKHKQNKDSSTNSEMNGDDLSNFSQKIVVKIERCDDTLISAKELLEINKNIAAMDKILEELESDVPSTTEADNIDLDSRLDYLNSMANKYFEMTSVAANVQPATTTKMDYRCNQDIVLCEKSNSAVISTPRSSGTDSIFDPENENIHRTCDANLDMQRDTSMETLRDTSRHSHTSEILYHVNPRLIALKDDYSKPDMKEKTERWLNLQSTANEELQKVKSVRHAESHRLVPLLSGDVNHVTSFTNNPFTTKLPLCVMETKPQVVNLGSKEEFKNPYGKCFYVGGTPKMERNTTEHMPTQKKAVAQTEYKISDVEKLPSSHANEHQPTSNSDGIQTARPSLHKPVSPRREKPEPTFLKGVTSEQDLPESRTEFNEEYGSVEMPNVNRLKAMFGGNKAADKAVTVKRVHSITARSVPKEKLEQLRHTVDDHLHSRTFVNVPNERNNTGHPAGLLTGQQMKLTPCLPKSVYQSNDFKSFEEQEITTNIAHQNQSMHISSIVKTSNRNSGDNKSKQTIKLHLSTGNINRPISPVAIGHPQTAQSIKPYVHGKAETPKAPANIPKPILKTGNEIDTPDGRKSPRIKTGAISAMSRFWENRLHEGFRDDNAPEILECD